MNVLEAAREVRKDRTKVFKAEGYTIRIGTLNTFAVLVTHDNFVWGLYDEIVNTQDLDFQPVLDPTKLKVDDPIEVRNSMEAKWERRHFAKYEDGLVYTWYDRATSWTNVGGCLPSPWNYWRLPEKGEK